MRTERGMSAMLRPRPATVSSGTRGNCPVADAPPFDFGPPAQLDAQAGGLLHGP